MTGVAGILRFNLPGLDDVDEIDSDSEADQTQSDDEEEDKGKKQTFDEQ